MISAYGTSGSNYDFFFFNASDQVWDSRDGVTAFVTWVDANYQHYRMAATELGATGRFSIDHFPSTSLRWEMRLRSGALSGSTIAETGAIAPPITLTKQGRVAGQDTENFVTISGVSGTTSGRTFVQTAKNFLLGRSYSEVNEVRVYKQATVDAGKVKFLVYRSGIRVAETPLFTIPETPNLESVFKLNQSISIEPGDQIGVYHIANSSDAAIAGKDDTGCIVKFGTGDLSTVAALGSELSNYSLMLEFLGSCPDVAFTGDSIIAGANTATPQVGNYDDTSQAHSRPEATMPWWIRKYLAANGINFNYANLGRGSQTFAWVLSTGVPDCLLLNPKSILIHCGVNDVSAGRSWSAVESDLNAIRVLVPYTTHLLIDEILPWTAGTAGNATTIRAFNTNLATWCLANHATLVKCHDFFKDPADPDNMLAAYNQDGVHLTSQGVQALARIQADALLGGLTTLGVENSTIVAKQKTLNQIRGLVV